MYSAVVLQLYNVVDYLHFVKRIVQKREENKAKEGKK